ncbi:MAG: hypothetical protein PHV16_02470 [Candidatus Nanoarchaeia archaeon]|nr:hypothetical protein [Candidatus Nanoarchaeia archaeon]
MNEKAKKVIYWAPRIIAILFILFISLFALDVFSEDYTFFQTIIGLFMHLIPAFILIAATCIAWKNEFVGGFVFIGIFVFFTIFFNTSREIITFSLISLPVLIIGLLFLLNSKQK